jgi:hypothetical protein
MSDATARPNRAHLRTRKALQLDIDFHLDFDLDPSWMHLDEVCRQADQYGAAASRSVMPASCRRSTLARCNPSGGVP